VARSHTVYPRDALGPLAAEGTDVAAPTRPRFRWPY
jgi:hypothetical protein